MYSNTQALHKKGGKWWQLHLLSEEILYSSLSTYVHLNFLAVPKCKKSAREHVEKYQFCKWVLLEGLKLSWKGEITKEKAHIILWQSKLKHQMSEGHIGYSHHRDGEEINKHGFVPHKWNDIDFSCICNLPYTKPSTKLVPYYILW